MLSLLRRFFSIGNILRFVITVVVLGAVGLLAVIGSDHLRGQFEAGRALSASANEGPLAAAGQPEFEGFKLRWVARF